jgi:hypothetical protein
MVARKYLLRGKRECFEVTLKKLSGRNKKTHGRVEQKYEARTYDMQVQWYLGIRP